MLVHLIGSYESSRSNSFYNEWHQNWAMKRVKELLAATEFRRVDKPDEPGTIMVIAPYRTAINNYRSLVRDLGESAKGRVDVRTVDTAQGNEADVVILDLVRTRTPGFMDDPHRLNVAITRARQAEIILMHPHMTKRKVGAELENTKYLLKMWEECDRRGRLIRIRP